MWAEPFAIKEKRKAEEDVERQCNDFLERTEWIGIQRTDRKDQMASRNWKEHAIQHREEKEAKIELYSQEMQLMVKIKLKVKHNVCTSVSTLHQLQLFRKISLLT